MKYVLYIITARGVGGIERRFSNLYKYYAESLIPIYDFTFLVSRASVQNLDGYKISPKNKNVKLIKFGLPVFQNERKIIRRIIRYIDYLCLLWTLFYKRIIFSKYDAAHFVNFSSLLFRRFIKSCTKVYSFVDSTPPHSKHNTILKIINTPNENIRIDCLSEKIKEELISMGISDKERLFTSPCSFIDYSKTGSKRKKKIVTFVGRLEQLKGIDLLISAIPIICQKHPELKIKILGYGPKYQEIKYIINKTNLSHRIYVGFSKEPIRELKESLIFLSLQRYENYPSQSLLEAMACENAIIATNVGLTYKIVNKDIGILINYDKHILIEAIDKMLNNIDRTIQMGKNAKKKAMENHNVQKYSKYMLNVLYH